MPEKRSVLKRAAWAGLAFAISALAAIGVSMYRAPLDRADERLVAALREATGLRVATNGAGYVSLFPFPHVRVSGVSLAYGDDPPFAAARELTGALRLTALMGGRIELSEITLSQPEVALDRAPLAEALGGLRKRDAGAPPALRISDGRLTLSGRVFDKVDAGLVWPRDGGPLALTGYGRYAGQQIEATFQLADLGAITRRERAPFRARIEGGGVRVMFDGEALDENGPRFAGELSARATSLGDTLSWLGVAAPSTVGPRFSLSLAGKASLDRDGLAVSNAELDLSGDSFLGAGRLTFTADGGPSIEATVDAGDLDAKPYAAIVAPQILLAEGGWSAAAIDLGGLSGWTLDLRLSAQSVKLGRYRLGQTAATVAVARGSLDLSIGEAEAYDGSVGGRLSLEPHPGGVRMTFDGAATDVAIDEALAPVLKAPPLSGALTGELSAQGIGTSAAQFMAVLTGKASGRIADGSLQNIGRSRTLALVGLGRRMTVDAASASFRLENGVARTEDVSIVGPDASFALVGEASLLDLDVDLKGSVKPAVGGWTLPVSLSGPLAAPKLKPDLAGRPPRGEARHDAAPANVAN